VANVKEQMLAEIDHVIEAARNLPLDPMKAQQFASEPFAMWKAHATAVVAATVPISHPLRKDLEGISHAQTSQVPHYIGFLSGLRNAMERGLLESIFTTAREVISADDIELAEAVLNDHAGADRSHIAAAVIAGATLERALRAKCALLGIDIHKPKTGERKAINALIDDAARADAITPLRAKQMRVWAGIRNHAAHGDFDLFTRDDVTSFLRDLPAVLAELK